MAATIRAGIGGWSFDPWRETFYGRAVPRARELEFASRQLRTIEINGSYYRTPKPTDWQAWHDATPEGFVFAVKAPRAAAWARAPGPALQRFLDSGLEALGAKLGPVLWQLPPTRRFDAAQLEDFLAALPDAQAGRPLRHVLDVRHESFRDPAFVALARRRGVAITLTASPEFPAIGDVTADLVYLRVMRTESSRREGCAPRVLDALAACARAWRDGAEPAGVPRVTPAAPPARPRDVFVFFIAGAKERAPAAAMALQRRIDAA